MGWNLELERMPAVCDKVERLSRQLERLGYSKPVTPEQMTQAMLQCGRKGDYAALLEELRSVKRGIVEFQLARKGGNPLASMDQYEAGLPADWSEEQRAEHFRTLLLSLGSPHAPEELAGMSLEQLKQLAAEQLEQSAQELRDQIMDEVELLWTDEAAATAAAQSDPFLTATVLSWAQDEGDIQLESTPAMIGVQAAANAEVTNLMAGGWEPQEIAEIVMLVACCVLYVGGLFLCIGSECGVGPWFMIGFGMMIAGLLIGVTEDLLEDNWDKAANFFASIRDAWRRRFGRAELVQDTLAPEAAPAVSHSRERKAPAYV